MATESTYVDPHGIKDYPHSPLILVPHVPGMLREPTVQAAENSRQRYLLATLDPADDGAYASLLIKHWDGYADLIVMEQDMVVTQEQIGGLIGCDQWWCGHRYHVGEGRYTTGLGLCRFSREVQQRYPLAAVHAARNPRTGGGVTHWSGLNERIEQVLTRWLVDFHLHPGDVGHLHYPEPDHAR